MIKNKDFLTMVEAAIKAPSGHNTQPWLFKLKENAIDVIPNLKYILPIVDPSNRELFISIGAAVENLCLKALELGYETSVKINIETEVATICLVKSDVKSDVLVDQIEKRQTNRNVYSAKIISDDIIHQLKNLSNNLYISQYIISKDDPLFETMKRYVSLGNEIQLNDEEFKDELLRYIRLNKKGVTDKPTGLSYKVMGAPSLPTFISKPIVKLLLKADKQNKGDMKKIDSSSHLILLTTQSNTLEEWILLGRYLQRFLLTLTSLNISSAYINQPMEIGELASQIKRKYPEFQREYPTLLLRIGYAKSAPFSPRQNIKNFLL